MHQVRRNLHRFISMIMALYKHHDLLCHHPFFWSALIFYIFIFVYIYIYVYISTVSVSLPVDEIR